MENDSRQRGLIEVPGHWMKFKMSGCWHWYRNSEPTHTACERRQIINASQWDDYEKQSLGNSPLRYPPKHICKDCLRYVVANNLDPWTHVRLRGVYISRMADSMVGNWPPEGMDKYCFTTWHCPACRKLTRVYNLPGDVSRQDVCSDDCWTLLYLQTEPEHVIDPIAKFESLRGKLFNSDREREKWVDPKARLVL